VGLCLPFQVVSVPKHLLSPFNRAISSGPQCDYAPTRVNCPYRRPSTLWVVLRSVRSHDPLELVSAFSPDFPSFVYICSTSIMLPSLFVFLCTRDSRWRIAPRCADFVRQRLGAVSYSCSPMSVLLHPLRYFRYWTVLKQCTSCPSLFFVSHAAQAEETHVRWASDQVFPADVSDGIPSFEAFESFWGHGANSRKSESLLRFFGEHRHVAKYSKQF